MKWESPKYKPPEKLSFKKAVVALLVTINLLALGGLQDVLYFILWAGGLPSNNIVWWWSEWIGIFGTWNSLTQVTFTLSMIGISLFTWALALYQKKKTCDYPL